MTRNTCYIPVILSLICLGVISAGTRAAADATRLGYIREVPPESSTARAERHRRVAERRRSTPVIVHRGASAYAPENTLEAYAAALDHGADGVEIDIRRSTDGVLYLFHDDTLDRMTGRSGQVSRLSYYELLSLEFKKLYGTATRETRIPTLAALLVLAQQRAMLLHLDIKEPGLEADIARIIDAADAWDHVVHVNDYNSAKLRQNRKLRLLKYKGWLSEAGEGPDGLRAFLARPGEMIFIGEDPAPAVAVVNRSPLSAVPLPPNLRAEWVASSSQPANIRKSTTTKSAPSAKPKLPPAPPGVIIEQDVTYLPPDRDEKLDLYLPAGRPRDVRSPAVVIIHGGGWTGGDKAASREFNIGTNLAQAGYVCASANYKLAGPKRWPTNLHDCKNAVRFLRANAKRYRIDPERIGVIGGSAGGHLALMVAYTTDVPELEPKQPYPGVSNRVRAVVNLYGITNLLTRQKTDAEGVPTGPFSRPAALLEGAGDQVSSYRLASPVFHVSTKSPPTLILHGRRDTTVDRDQATELAARLAEKGVEHQLIMLDNVGHTFDLQTWRRKPLPMDLRPVVIGFFDKHLAAGDKAR